MLRTLTLPRRVTAAWTLSIGWAVRYSGLLTTRSSRVVRTASAEIAAAMRAAGVPAVSSSLRTLRATSGREGSTTRLA